jgi:hypothetical protein
MNITVHIEQLILDGLPVDRADGAVVRAAVQTELTRLLTEGSHLTGLQRRQALAFLRGTDLHLAGGRTPDDLGRQIAHSVHEGFTT